MANTAAPAPTARNRSAVRPDQLQADDVTADGSVVASIAVDGRTGMVRVTWANGHVTGPHAPSQTFRLRKAR